MQNALRLAPEILGCDVGQSILWGSRDKDFDGRLLAFASIRVFLSR